MSTLCCLTGLTSLPWSLVTVRALTLDFGGTLDGKEHWRERFWRLYVSAGLGGDRLAFDDAFAEATRAAYAEPRLRTATLDVLVRYHLRRQLETLRVPWSARAERVAEEFAATTRRSLYEHYGLVARWAKRVRLGVISNFYGNLEVILRECGLAPLFGALLDSTLVGHWKPSREIFLAAAEELNCDVGEVLHVGDSLFHDVQGAIAAGMRAAWLLPSGNLPEGAAIPPATVCLRQLAELDVYLPCKLL